MPIVCGIQFRGTGKIYFFDPGEYDLQVEDHVIVETSRGKELGQVVMPIHEVDESEVVGELKPVLRRATTIDLLDAQRYRQQEEEAMATCKEQVKRFNLPMKIVGGEYNYDGTRLTFFFTAEQRVDFRELVRELARIFKTRIELRQIGVRDEAKILGGMGKCGRRLCCSTWLTDFRPVSIRMAKQQNLPLSPMEISGLCGRLLCCLLYENDYYREIKSRFPRVGKMIDTPYGPGKVVRVSVLKETVSVLLEDGSTAEIEAEELDRPRDPETERHNRESRRQQSLDKALENQNVSPPSNQNPEGQGSTEGQPSRRRRSRSRRRPNRSRKSGDESNSRGRNEASKDRSSGGGQGQSEGSSTRQRRRRPRRRRKPDQRN